MYVCVSVFVAVSAAAAAVIVVSCVALFSCAHHIAIPTLHNLLRSVLSKVVCTPLYQEPSDHPPNLSLSTGTIVQTNRVEEGEGAKQTSKIKKRPSTKLIAPRGS